MDDWFVVNCIIARVFLFWGWRLETGDWDLWCVVQAVVEKSQAYALWTGRWLKLLLETLHEALVSW